MSLLHEKFRKLKEVILSTNPNPWYGFMVQAVNELEAVLPAEEVFTPAPIVEIIPTVEEIETPTVEETEVTAVEETPAPKKGRKPSTTA